jgi:DNA polymerase III subunit beta
MDCKDFAAAVAWARQATDQRAVTPLFAAIQVAWDGEGRAVVSGFDGDTYVAADIEAVTSGPPGSVLVSGARLHQVAGKLPGEAVTVGADGEEFVSVACGSAHWRLRAMPAGEDGGYPGTLTQPAPAGTVDGEALAAALRSVVPAVSRDATVPALTGVLVETDGSTLRLVACDRYRLHLAEVAWEPDGTPVMPSALIPGYVLAEVARHAAGLVTVHLGKDPARLAGLGLAGFTFQGRTLTTRLIGDKYPDYGHMVTAHTPGAPAMTASVVAGPLIQALERVALVKAKDQAISVTFRDSEVVVAVVSSADAAESEETMGADVTWAAGDHPAERTVLFNPDFLAAALAAGGQEQMQFAFRAPHLATIITDSDGNEAFRGILMHKQVPGQKAA